MVSSKKLSAEKPAKAKKDEKKMNKNNSFSGVEQQKSPKSRRKSITTLLPTPLKKNKEKSLNTWIVTDNRIKNKDTVVKKKQVVISFSSDEENGEPETPLIKTPNVNSKKKTKVSIISDQGNKSSKKGVQSTNIKTSAVIQNKEKTALEEKYGIESTVIAQAVEAVIKLRRENPKLKNQLFDDLFPLFLQVSCHKVPKGPSRIIRIPIPNSLLTADSEVCLIVPEVKGVKNIEHEKHIEHYENLLQGKGVENIKKIMTFHEFRTEYETFEQKSRLVDLYDAFLVDGRISGKVVKKCGKIFYKKRKVPTSVKLRASKLKENIDKALSKAFLFQHLKGDSYNVQFGHDKMNTEDLVDNVFAVIEGWNKEFPGGFENIKGMHVSAIRATSIPIYSSFKSPRELKNPKVKPRKTKVFKTYTGELTTQLNAEVTVKPTGEVLVKRTINETDDSEGNKTRKRKLSESKTTQEVEQTQDSKDQIKGIKKKKLKTSDENSGGKKEVNDTKTKKKIKKQNQVSNGRVEKKSEESLVIQKNVAESSNEKIKKKKKTEINGNAIGDINGLSSKKAVKSKNKVKLGKIKSNKGVMGSPKLHIDKSKKTKTK